MNEPLTKEHVRKHYSSGAVAYYESGAPVRMMTPEESEYAVRRFDEWLAEVERAAAEKALTEAANELTLLDDGGKRGLAGHSKSSASAITHRHAVAVIRARAEAYRQERGEQ